MKLLIKIILLLTIISLLFSACQKTILDNDTPTPTQKVSINPTNIPITSAPTPEPSKSPQLPLNIEFSEYEFNDDDKRLYIKSNSLENQNYDIGSIGDLLSKDIKSDTDPLDEFIRAQSVEFPATDENYVSYGLTTIPSIMENSEEFISLYIDYYTYTGGAHGNIERIAYTYSKEGIKHSNFMDLVNNGVTKNDIESEINQQIAIIIEDMGPAFFQETISLESFDPLPSFYLIDGQMVIYFQTYDIAPYAYGIPEFTMPPEIFSY